MANKKSIKIKFVGLMVALTICFLLVGVSVYAALTQSLSIDNNITISSSGQTQVEVKVFEYANAGTNAVDVVPTTINFPADAVVTKTADENDISGNLTDIIFRSDGNTNFYAFKMSFNNISDKTAYAHISATAINNSQLKLLYGESLENLATLGNNTELANQVELNATDNKDFYLIVASNVDLVNLSAMEMQQFSVSILIDQISV